jgi:hypothetical protein
MQLPIRADDASSMLKSVYCYSMVACAPRDGIRMTGSDLTLPRPSEQSSSPSSHATTLSPLLRSWPMRHVPRSLIVAMPLRSLPRGSIALRSARGGTTLRTCGVGAGVGRLTQKRWASDKKPGNDEEKPFYLQLNESIFERVQKERAEQIQIQSLQQRTARGQFFATVVGMSFPTLL